MTTNRRKAPSARQRPGTAPQKKAYALASNPTAVRMAIQRLQDDAVARGHLVLKDPNLSIEERAELATIQMGRAAVRVARLQPLLETS